MSALRVLDLSYTGIEILPDSVSLLRVLTALIARECKCLRYVPSLAPLLALEVLDLGNTAIEEVPQGIEMLINLRDLTLISPHLKLFPTGILSKLSRLQRLQIHSGLLKADEVAGLSKLEILSCQFNDVDFFHTYMKLQQWRLLNSYFLLVGPIELADLGEPSNYEKCVELRECNIGEGKDPLMLPNDFEVLFIEYLITGSNYVKRVQLMKCNIGEGKDPLMLPNDIEELNIEECDAVRSLSDILSFNNASVLPESSRSPYRTCATIPLLCLRLLVLKDLDNLQVLFREEGGVQSPTLPPSTFSCLNKLVIRNCEKIKQLFTPGLVSNLQNLEQLVVSDCGTMEVIIAAEGEEEEEEEGRGEGRNNQSVVKNDAIITICLPKLRVLRLDNLPNLKSIICRRGVLACDGVERITVLRCSNLMRLGISLPVRNGQPSPPPSLRVIATFGEEWWNSLEWDNPIVKDVLQSFVRQLNY